MTVLWFLGPSCGSQWGWGGLRSVTITPKKASAATLVYYHGYITQTFGVLSWKVESNSGRVSRLPAETFSWSVNVIFFREPFLILRKVATCKTRLMLKAIPSGGPGAWGHGRSVTCWRRTDIGFEMIPCRARNLPTQTMWSVTLAHGQSSSFREQTDPGVCHAFSSALRAAASVL